MPDIIPYEAWAYSQLSIAKYAGGIKIQGKEYRLDYDGCTIENNKLKTVEGEYIYFPDLVIDSVRIKLKKERKKKPDIQQEVLFLN